MHFFRFVAVYTYSLLFLLPSHALIVVKTDNDHIIVNNNKSFRYELRQVADDIASAHFFQALILLMASHLKYETKN